MFKLFTSNFKELGTCVEVHLDEDSGLIKRQYKYDAITCNGSITTKTPEEINHFFENEVYWLKKLESTWIPKTYEINYSTKTIIQEYTHPCLLNHLSNLHEYIPDIEEQVLEMYKFFKKHDVFKGNGSLSNMTLKGSQVQAFDFKWAAHRPDNLTMELKSYDVWLKKISPSLTDELKKLL
jgi:hypothetical protein